MENNYSVVYVENQDNYLTQVWLSVKRAFREFLTLPTIILVVFILLSVCANTADHQHYEWLQELRKFMKKTIFHNGKATGDLLGTIASSIITVLSLTITLLLIVVQQTSSSLTTQVFDQFLRARHNQIYFGFFVGLSFYSLIILASVNDSFNPVIGATLAFLLSMIAIYLLLILIYTTINDMRPAVIIGAIYDHIITARKNQLSFISKTRSEPCFEGLFQVSIKTNRPGYFINISENVILDAIKCITSEAEVVFTVSIGDYLSFEDEIAYVTANSIEDGKKIGNAVGKAIEIDRQREINNDAANGVKQLKMMAWTTISTAKQSQSPGLTVIRTLGNLLLRWSSEGTEMVKKAYPIVYRDNVLPQLMDTLETLAVATSESMQHENFKEIIHTFANSYNRMSHENKVRTEDIIMRILSAMGDHVLTAPLEVELYRLVKVLKEAGSLKTAAALEIATRTLKESVGKLNSRSTRIK